MLAHRIAVLLVLVPALALAGCAGSDRQGPATVSEDFEKGIRSWDEAADIPQDPNRPAENVSWSIEVTREHAVSGDFGVNYTLDGSQGDGTIWLVQPLSVESGQAYRANVTVEAWSQTRSDNTLAHLVLYLGTERPIAEDDFPPAGENTTDDPEAERGGLREPLNKQEGWRTYGFGWQVPSTNNGTLYAAVGISAVFETEVTYFVDDLTIRLEPIEA